MIKRSEKLLKVGFFLSKFGEKIPPPILETTSWKVAYHMFYENLNGGRDLLSFEHSLKNSRDAYDGFFPNTMREGWKDENAGPKKLGYLSGQVYSELNNFSELEVWNQISKHAILKVREYEPIFENLAAIEDSERQSCKTKTEGGIKVYISAKIERNPSLRNDAFAIHGYDCIACGFNFEKAYGEWGKNWAEVHHLKPLSEDAEKRETNPESDLAVVFANCHRMIHRKRGLVLTIEEIKSKIQSFGECKGECVP